MSSISKIIKDNQLKSYFILTFAITWVIMFLPMIFPIEDPIISILIMAIGGSGPALAAIILSYTLKPKKLESQQLKRWSVFLIALIITASIIILYNNIALNNISIPLLLLILINGAIAAYIISGCLASTQGIRELLGRLYIWKVDLKWYLIAPLLPAFICFMALILGIFSSGSPLSGIWPQISWDALLGFILTCGFFGLVRGPLREEIGWRGFALPRLQHLYSPLVGSLILGIIWTVWHLPLHLNGTYPGGIEAFIERFYSNIAVTFLLTWVYNHARGSLLLTTIFHLSINTSLAFIFSVATGPYMFIYWILINLAALIVIIADKMWNKLPEDSESVYEY